MDQKRIPIIFPDGPLNSIENEVIFTDPFGSYTGLVQSLDEKPVQDADDL